LSDQLKRLGISIHECGEGPYLVSSTDEKDIPVHI